MKLSIVQALAILELQSPFTMVELKKAYRNAALKTHPDCGGSNEEFILVDAAYDTNSQFAIRNSQLRNLDLARLSALISKSQFTISIPPISSVSLNTNTRYSNFYIIKVRGLYHQWFNFELRPQLRIANCELRIVVRCF